MSERKPFHESIIDTINEAGNSSEMKLLAGLIKGTKIPKNHGAIGLAWAHSCGIMAVHDDYGVFEDLATQKQEAEAKEAAKQEQQEAPHVSAKAEGD